MKHLMTGVVLLPAMAVMLCGSSMQASGAICHIGVSYTEMNTIVRSGNEPLAATDTCVFGKDYMGATAQQVPDRSFAVGK